MTYRILIFLYLVFDGALVQIKKKNIWNFDIYMYIRSPVCVLKLRHFLLRYRTYPERWRRFLHNFWNGFYATLITYGTAQ
jgi:hypothetical protein